MSCQSIKYIGEYPVLKTSCQLSDQLNDTIIVEGIYSTCIEYSSFQTIKKDRCYKNFKMELDLSEPSIDKDIAKKIYKMNACNATRRIVLKGWIQRDELGYGHLNSNSYRINVLEIIEFDSIKYSRF